jgi:phosphate transport system substrate-binding protein
MHAAALQTRILLGAAGALLLALPLGAQILINGAGATFPAPLYTKWFSHYRAVDSTVAINYQAIGSGGGIRQLTEGTVDFGASDTPMSDAQMRDYRARYGSGILQFPTVLGAAVPTYNVPGVTQSLAFTPEMLANIFLGKITKWNDPAIRDANPEAKLPGDDIVVLHRSDGSGTTYCWTDFLSKVSPEWRERVGKNTSVKWPAGLGGKGNEGVLGLLKQTPGSIAYVELSYVLRNRLAYGRVQNPAGVFVKADLKSITAAAAGAVSSIPDDFRVSITNAPGKDAYPISTFTWLLIPSHIPDASKREGMKKLLRWILTKGQASARPLGFAELPKPLVARELAAVSQIR